MIDIITLWYVVCCCRIVTMILLEQLFTLLYPLFFISLTAPEILQGKYGHSFEVDVWSTGVIIYTLLVGKPPFESKDVKSTYKRILANSFSFPDTQQPICEHAKGLVRNILQVGKRLRFESIFDSSSLFWFAVWRFWHWLIIQSFTRNCSTAKACE